MRTTLLAFLLLIGTVGVGQGVLNIELDPSSKDTFYFGKYYTHYAINFNYITKIPSGVYAVVLGRGDSIQYLWEWNPKTDMRFRWSGDINTIANTIIILWEEYEGSCGFDTVFMSDSSYFFMPRYLNFHGFIKYLKAE